MSFCPHCGKQIETEKPKEAFRNFPEENISLDKLFEEEVEEPQIKPTENVSKAQKAYDKANAMKLAEDISKW